MNNSSFILSEIQLVYKPKVPAAKKPQLKNSEDAYRQFLLLFDQSQFTIKEEAAVLFVNRSNRILGGYKLSSGGITGTVVDIRIILACALKSLASGIFIAHTHPSGELKPSNSDLILTRSLKQSSEVMDINLIDHLILSSSGYLSMVEEGKPPSNPSC